MATGMPGRAGSAARRLPIGAAGAAPASALLQFVAPECVLSQAGCERVVAFLECVHRARKPTHPEDAMHTFPSTFSSEPTVLRKAVGAAIGIALAGVVALAFATAGPGNVERSRVVRVSLPQVTVVGHREPEVPAVATTVVGCVRSPVDAARGARKLG